MTRSALPPQLNHPELLREVPGANATLLVYEAVGKVAWDAWLDQIAVEQKRDAIVPNHFDYCLRLIGDSNDN